MSVAGRQFRGGSKTVAPSTKLAGAPKDARQVPRAYDLGAAAFSFGPRDLDF
ncbi:hypothetical protein AB7M49_004492 [Bradyrhizobium elkanii]